ncbi:hypothetical protein ACFZBP_37640 [Streptomyces sp. NPDC008086]|uniref:hypothetical protein n=1 Tax=Streptomyces sp. NPDC008086 TaxID=3364807 RepID=UPI0036EB0892
MAVAGVVVGEASYEVVQRQMCVVGGEFRQLGQALVDRALGVFDQAVGESTVASGGTGRTWSGRSWSGSTASGRPGSASRYSVCRSGSISCGGG